jgi:hypothetical protein
MVAQNLNTSPDKHGFLVTRREALEARKKILLILFSTIFLLATSATLSRPIFASETSETLIWEAYVPSTGLNVATNVTLFQGEQYRIVASDRWWYSMPTENNLAADAQYYTTDFTDSWNWGNHFQIDGHSFLQINGNDVDWGPFSNGDTNHTYTILYNGQGALVTFRIVDWVDGNYTNNQCKLDVKIYEEITVGGHIVDFNPLDVTPFWVLGSVAVAFSIVVSLVYRSKVGRARSALP